MCQPKHEEKLDSLTLSFKNLLFFVLSRLLNSTYKNLIHDLD